MSSPISPLPVYRQPKLLFIGIDGFRADCVYASIDAAGKPLCPNIYQLLTKHTKSNDHTSSQTSSSTITSPTRATAYSFHTLVNDICWSGPGWSSIATGVWRDKHLIPDNEFKEAQLHKYPNLFHHVSER